MALSIDKLTQKCGTSRDPTPRQRTIHKQWLLGEGLPSFGNEPIKGCLKWNG